MSTNVNSLCSRDAQREGIHGIEGKMRESLGGLDSAGRRGDANVGTEHETSARARTRSSASASASQLLLLQNCKRRDWAVARTATATATAVPLREWVGRSGT